ncbi:hypothetical protein [Sphingomonas phage Birtae]|nr:hypothetical protein [Sphingomonas phage Birtae]
MAYHEVEIRILGGLPVTFEYNIAGAEPDVGISSAYVDDYYIVAVNGRYPKKGAKNPFAWVEKRIAATKGEEARIREELNEDAAQIDY